MGKKYIIEFEDKPFHKEDGDFLYRVKGFNSLVFDMTGIGKLTPYTEPDLEQVRKEARLEGWKKGYKTGYKERKREEEIGDREEANNTGYKIGYEKGYRDGVNRIGDAEDKIRKEAYEKGYKTAKCQCNIQAEKDLREVGERHYQKGLSDAWEAARKICGSVTAGALSYSTLNAIFGSRYPEHIVDTFTASEVIEELRAHEQAQKEAEEQLQKEEEKSISVEDVMRRYLDMFCRNTEGCAECPLNTFDFTCGRGYHFMTDEGLVSDEEVRKAYVTVLEKMRGENND